MNLLLAGAFFDHGIRKSRPSGPRPQNFTFRATSDTERVTLASFTDDECVRHFRFHKADIPRLQAALGIDEDFSVRKKFECTGEEALLILLRRLASPARLYDLVYFFNRSETGLSHIFNAMVRHLMSKWDELIQLSVSVLTPEKLEEYAAAIHSYGAPLDCIFGFLDGTLRPCARPGHASVYQEVLFSGHKRLHGWKFQGLTLPNGLIAGLHGPLAGKVNDQKMLSESGLEDWMFGNATDTRGNRLYAYGDAGYRDRPNLMTPYREATHHLVRMFNDDMAKARASVEHSFGIVASYWRYLNSKAELRTFQQPIGSYYRIAVLLTNCHTCLYGNQISTTFGVLPPSLEDYLKIVDIPLIARRV